MVVGWFGSVEYKFILSHPTNLSFLGAFSLNTFFRNGLVFSGCKFILFDRSYWLLSSTLSVNLFFLSGALSVESSIPDWWPRFEERLANTAMYANDT